MTCRLLLLSFLMLCAGGSAAAQSGPAPAQRGKPVPVPASVTICQLSESPAEFADKVVVVHAYVKGGIPHGDMLWDPNCPRVGIGVDLTDSPDVRELVDAMDHHGFPGAGAEKIVFGDFTGKFSWQPEKQTCQRTLFITQAQRVSVIDNPAVPLF